MEVKIAHLGFIQGIINRMGTNSFFLKGWSVTLVAAMFALAVKDSDKNFMLLSCFPVVLFWILDGYFLHQERLFRKLYEKVAAGEVASAQFTLDTTIVRDEVKNWFLVIFSKTLILFHGVLFSLVVFAMCALKP